MERVRVAGRTYTDPDIISLIKQTGSLVDPRSAVVTQARRLIALFHQFEGTIPDSIERMKAIASMKGIKVEAMDIEQQRAEKRDAALVPTQGGYMVLYNPRRPKARVAFSIAHEVVHTFFPNSVSGARFRHIVADGSKEANELERLCDLGAAEILMPYEEFQRAMGPTPTIRSVERLSVLFGASFEATLFRLATAHKGLAVTGLLQYRFTRGEERQLHSPKQQDLFGGAESSRRQAPVSKYRRQSFFTSEGCDSGHFIPWNKSFDPDSVVYQAGCNGGIHTAIEALPNEVAMEGRLEAIRAPYQRHDANAEYGDVLFVWQEADLQ